jgi:hypothetical protein
MFEWLRTRASVLSSQGFSSSTSGLIFRCRTARRSSALWPGISASISDNLAIRSRASVAIGARCGIGEFEELPSAMRPTIGQADRAAVALRIGKPAVGGVAVSLEHTGEFPEQRHGMLGAATRRIVVHHRRRCAGIKDLGRLLPRPRDRRCYQLKKAASAMTANAAAARSFCWASS